MPVLHRRVDRPVPQYPLDNVQVRPILYGLGPYRVPQGVGTEFHPALMPAPSITRRTERLRPDTVR